MSTNQTCQPVVTQKIVGFLTAFLSLDAAIDDDFPDLPPEDPDFPALAGRPKPDRSDASLLELMRRGIEDAEREIAIREAEEAGPQLRRPHRSEATTLIALASLAMALPEDSQLGSISAPGTITLVMPPAGFEGVTEKALSRQILRHLRARAGIRPDEADPKIQICAPDMAMHPKDRASEMRIFRSKLRPLLEQGASVLIVSPDREVIDGDLADLCHLILQLPRPTPEAVTESMRLTHPEDFDEMEVHALLPSRADLARLSALSINAAFFGASSHEVVRSLARNGISVPGSGPLLLEDMHGQPDAVRLMRQMVADLAQWQAGQLDWSEVTASALLYGPPGTGKTTMARALAGTAGVPLISTSYAECQKMGHQGDMLAELSARVREAIRKAPSVFLIDEIDSFTVRTGTDRNASYMRGVTNGLLRELTRLAQTPGVIVLAATNHPGDVDPAVVRSGRLDAKVAMELPSLHGISAQLEAGLARLQPSPLISDRERSRLARQLLGSSGADIAALLRSAAGMARETGGSVTIEQLHSAADKLAPRLDPALDERMAIHEAGHVLAGYLLRRPMPISVRLTSQGGSVISPRTQYHTLETASAELTVLLAGRMAEILVYGDVSSGAGEGGQSDLALATRVALKIDRQWHLSDDGLTWFDIDSTPSLLTDQRLRERVEGRLRAAETEATHLLSQHIKYIHRLARVLLRERELDTGWIHKILRGIEYEDVPATGAEVIPFPNFSGEE
ncbi:AAA family ATPase [Rhodobacter maris]|uniref:Peptidase M41-like protein n=1 Tax=Rhodobacter maris TaxID=446682 RepID=A0A285RM94_9RHOB|nr:AAA family ATPase [Rhodobacter maris]SOB95235.1 peptidase M41-like protein [Rhodobacter maris]